MFARGRFIYPKFWVVISTVILFLMVLMVIACLIGTPGWGERLFYIASFGFMGAAPLAACFINVFWKMDGALVWGLGKSSRAEPLAISDIDGIGVAWTDHDFLPLMQHAPIIVTEGEGFDRYIRMTPFAMYWWRKKPSRGSVMRAQKIADWLGVPYLGLLEDISD